MKGIFLLIPGLAMTASVAWAQQSDVSQLEVHYKFSYIRDTTHRDKPYTENMVLLVGKKCGVYRSNEGGQQEQVTPNPDGTTRRDIHHFGSPAEYYQYPNENRLIRSDRIFESLFLITGALPAMDWRVTGDTATLGGLHCQKARTHFKGRDYTAWFCPDVPLPIGPWKLNGLPGVILEAYDAQNEVRFSFDGITKTGAIAILPPEKGVHTTEKEFVRLQETWRKDPQAFLNGMAQGSGRPAPKIDVKPVPGSVLNNPIELPEKK